MKISKKIINNILGDKLEGDKESKNDLVQTLGKTRLLQMKSNIDNAPQRAETTKKKWNKEIGSKIY